MGLFSSSTEYFAYAGSSDLFEEDERPDTVKALMLQATIGNEVTISESIKLALQTDMYARARSMIRYALRSFVRGLPETNATRVIVTIEAIDAAIESELGVPVSVRWQVSGPLNEDFHIDRHLKENYLNPVFFPWPEGDPVDPTWDENRDIIEIPVINPDTGIYYTTDNNPTYSRVSPSSPIYSISFPYTDNLGQPAVWAMPGTADFTVFDAGDWVQARYWILPIVPGQETFYWVYEIGSGGHPDLDADIESRTIEGEYLPVAILMHDKVWFDDPIGTDLEITTNRLLKKLALDGTEIKEDYLIQKAEDDASQDQDKSNAEEWDFFIHFAVPIHSKIRGSLEYLYHFFRLMRPASNSFDFYQAGIAGGNTPLFTELLITEGDVNGFNVELRWHYIHSETFPGEFLVNGVPLLPRRMHSVLVERTASNDAAYRVVLEEIHGTGINIGTWSEDNSTGYHDYIVVTQQHQDSAGVKSYTRVIVMGPSMAYVINTSEDSGDFRFRKALPLLFGLEEEEDEFRLPVHIGAMNNVSRMHREEMLSDALCATVFLVESRKVKWYQTGFFKWLIILIVVIIIVLSFRFEFLPKLAALASAAVGTTAAGLWLIYVTLTFALGFLISFAGSLIGGRLGILFVLVGSLVAARANPFSNLSAKWGSLTTKVSWGSAFEFIKATAPFTNFAMTVAQDISLQKLESDMREFLKTAREKQDALQDAWDALGPLPTWLDPMDLIRIQSTTYIESADNFIERTLNANPGLLGYDLISNFIEMALILPEDQGDMSIIQGVFNDFERQRGAA